MTSDDVLILLKQRGDSLRRHHKKEYPFCLEDYAEMEILRLRSRVEELEAALKKAVSNLSHVAVYDDANEDDTEAISARAAWNRDLDAIRNALSPALFQRSEDT